MVKASLIAIAVLHLLLSVQAATAATFPAQKEIEQSGPASASRNETNPDEVRSTQRFPIAVSLVLNDRHLGEIDVQVGTGGPKDVAVDRARLLELLEPHIAEDFASALPALRDNARFIEITDIPEDPVSIALDQGTLQLQAVVSAEKQRGVGLSLAARNRGLGSGPYAEPARIAVGINPRMQWRYTESDAGTMDGFDPLRATVSGFASYNGARGVALFGGADYDGRRNDPWIRRSLRAVHDDPERAIRIEAGEILSPYRSLQGSGEIVGLSIARRFDQLQPMRNLAPTGRQEFLLQRPSTVEFIVNGVTVRTLDLEAGRYRVADFPLFTGGNDVRIIAEDGVNRINVLDTSFYFDPQLLERGLVDFGASVGQLANQNGSPTVASGYFRTGITNSATLGVNYQGSESDRHLFGAEGEFATPLGFVLVDAALSSDSGNVGYSSFVQLRKTMTVTDLDDLVLDFSAEARSRDFVNPFQDSINNPQRWRTQASVSYRGYSDWTVRANGFFENNRTRNDQWGAGLSVGKANLNATLRYAEGNASSEGLSFSISLRRNFGERLRAGGTYSTSGNRSSLYLSRPVPSQLGALSLGTRIANSDSNLITRSSAIYTHNRFASDIEHQWQRNHETGVENHEVSGQAETFIGYADGIIGVGRPSGNNESFIVARRNKSLAGTDVVATDMSGTRIEAKLGILPTVVPVGRSYRTDTVFFEADKLPLGYAIRESQIHVNPPAASGYVFEYGSDDWRSALGTFIDTEGNPLSNAIASICRNGESQVFFTNSSGRFVLDGVSPGDYEVIISNRTVGTLSLEAKGEEALINVGTKTLQIDAGGIPLDSAPVSACDTG